MQQEMQTFLKMPASKDMGPQSYNCKELNSFSDKNKLGRDFFFPLAPLDGNSAQPTEIPAL